MRKFILTAAIAAMTLLGRPAGAEEAVIELPSGWTADYSENGWLLRHSDGSVISVSETLQADGRTHTVALATLYVRGDMECIDATEWTFVLTEGPAVPIVTAMSVDRSLTGPESTVTVHLPWPRHVVRDFRRHVDSAARGGICYYRTL